MNKEITPYNEFSKKAPEILQELKKFNQILGKRYDCSNLPIKKIYEMRNKKCCEDIAEHLINECKKIGLIANKYLIFDIDELERDNNNRIYKTKSNRLALKNYPAIKPWVAHFVCESEGLALEPLIGKPIELGLLTMELFGEKRTLHKMKPQTVYSPGDIIRILDARGVLPQ